MSVCNHGEPRNCDQYRSEWRVISSIPSKKKRKPKKKPKKKPEMRIVNEICFNCQGRKQMSSGFESNGWDTTWVDCPTCKGRGIIMTTYQKVWKLIWERV
jgi:hypothetical protein